MKLEYLLYFLEISRSHSINATSKKLGISQQTLSSAMAALEKHLSLTLLTRTNKGVFLTEDGEYFKKEAQKIVDILNQVKNYSSAKQAFIPSRINGNLNIIATPVFSSPIFSHSILPACLEKFVDYYPNVNINLIELSPPACIERLEQNDYDVMLFNIGTEYYERYLKNSLQYANVQLLSKDEIVAQVGKNNLLFQKKYISKKDIRSSDIVFFSSSDKDENWILKELINRNQTPHKVLKTTNKQILFNFVVNNNYIGFFPKMLIASRSAHNDYRFIPLKDKIYQYNVLVYNKDRFTFPYLQHFTQLLKDALL